MKKFVLSTLIILYVFTFNLSAQKDTIWYDSNWKKTAKSNASYYRSEVLKKGDFYWFVDYYISGSKQMEGLSLDKDKEVYQGVIKWYHENGKLKSEEDYKEGKKDGKWKELFENGNVKETGSYENGQKEGIWKSYYTNGKLKHEGKYVFDRKVDIWKTNYYDGTLENE